MIIRRDYKGESLPLLAMGCMRLPVIDGVYAHIDEPQVADMVKAAFDAGVNYFDTAWGYHDGNSEAAMGRALAPYDRDSYFLATKFPGYDPANWDKVAEIFEAQLERCATDFFDFYLIHNVCEMNVDAYLDDERYGIVSYLLEQKRAGRIKHLGCSMHGDLRCMKRFLDAHAADMEFVQLQVNWFDWEFQQAREKVEMVRACGLPVWVMEPLRGGKLAELPSDQMARLQALRPDETAAQWALHFLETVPGVTTVLTGASSLEQFEQNVATLSVSAPLNDAEQAALASIAADMNNDSVPCTECRYCTAHCPLELDIPHLLALYNQRRITGEGDFISAMALGALDADKQPSSCIACGACATVCPQQIDIPAELAKFATLMGK